MFLKPQYAVNCVMNKSSKRNIRVPVVVLLIFIMVLFLMAFTDMFMPLIAYIHSQEITPLQVLFCIAGSILGFFIVFKVLVKLGEFFLPDDSLKR